MFTKNRKIIKLGENFDSFAQFEQVFKTHCEHTYQIFTKRSSRLLNLNHIRNGTDEQKELIKNQIIYEDIGWVYSYADVRIEN